MEPGEGIGPQGWVACEAAKAMAPGVLDQVTLVWNWWNKGSQGTSHRPGIGWRNRGVPRTVAHPGWRVSWSGMLIGRCVSPKVRANVVAATDVIGSLLLRPGKEIDHIHSTGVGHDCADKNVPPHSDLCPEVSAGGATSDPDLLPIPSVGRTVRLNPLDRCLDVLDRSREMVAAQGI